MADETTEFKNEQFISEELREWGGKVRRELILSVDRYKAIKTGVLKRSLNVYVKGKELKFVFAGYGRFVDMGVGRGVSVGTRGTEAFKKSRKETGQLKKYKREAKKFYSKTTYGMLSQLHEGLLKGYADEVVNSLKTELKKLR